MGRLADMAASNPVTVVNPEELYRVITGITDQNPTVLKASAIRFEEMLQMQGTFHSLNAIATTRNLPLNVRQQAIIQFKNKALGQWRSKRLSTDEQKQDIRARCLSLLDEPDDVISDCNKFVIAKIARTDYPSQWPLLMPQLLEVTQKSLESFISSAGSDMNAYLISRRALDIMNAVLKEFASIKMPSGMRVSGQLVTDLSLPLQALYGAFAQRQMGFLGSTNTFTQQTAGTAHIAHLLYKCLSKMAVWAWSRVCASQFQDLAPWVHAFYQSSCDQFMVLTELRTNLLLSLNMKNERPRDEYIAHSIDMLSRQTRHFGKFFRRIQQLNPTRFVNLEGSDSIVFFYWKKVVEATNASPEQISDSHFAVFPIRFLVQALVIFRESLGQWSLTKQGPGSSQTFSKEFVEEAVTLLITRFIPLNLKDIEAWLADPEEWANAEDKESDQWEYELRPCGERVLMSFAKQYTDFVTPMLKSTFERLAGLPASDLETIVQKEAFYCAIGRCARYVVDAIPFDHWVSQSLVNEARDTDPNYRIIKRRIAWLLGKWVSDECSKPTTDVWNILVHLLSDRSPGSDSVVRFAAASAIKDCIDSLAFDVGQFSPYLPTVVSQLVTLLREADTLEAKRRVTQCLNVLIERIDDRIVPFVEGVASPIPELWKEAEGDSAEYLYKASLLDTVTRLIQATRVNSVTLNPISVPIVQEVFLNKEARDKLDSDGLMLWKAAVENAATLDSVGGGPSLLDIFPIAMDLLADNLDLLGSITSIVRSYLVLDAQRLIQAHSIRLFSALHSSFGKAMQTNQVDIVGILQLMAQLAPAQMWAESLHASGLLTELCKMLVEDKVATTLLSSIVCTFARFSMNDANMFLQLLAASASSLGKPESEIVNSVLDQWWRRFDNMSEPRQRKLLAMGIACLVATGRPEVLERLNGEIFNLWLDVFGEMKEALREMKEEGNDPTASTLSSLVLFWKDDGSELPSSLDDIKDKPEYDRWKIIYAMDPVETQKLTAFVGQCLQQAGSTTPNLESQYLANGDPAVLQQLQTHLSS